MTLETRVTSSRSLKILTECPFCEADLTRPGTGGNGSPADHLRECEAFQEALGDLGAPATTSASSSHRPQQPRSADRVDTPGAE